MAKETINDDDDDKKVPYKKSADIQVAGMLLYYILSGGHHPFGKGPLCEVNILKGNSNYNLDHVQDVIAKDLIERMINEDPKKRPTVEECLAHPYFWGNEKILDYLKLVGNEEEVKHYFYKTNKELHKNRMAGLRQRTEKGLFDGWKGKMKDKLPSEVFLDMESYRKNKGYSEKEPFELLRFIRNLHEHHAVVAADIDLMEMFPGLLLCIYLFAQDQGWNTRVTLKKFMATKIITLKEPLHTQRKWLRISERWSKQLEKLANTHEDDKVVKVGNGVMGKGDEFHIAKGSDGTEVYLGLRDDGTEVAVKRMTRENYKWLKNEKDFLRLPELDDPSIVRYVDFVEDENFGYLVLQLCEYTLAEYITKGIEFPGGRLSERAIAQQVLTGLKILHHQDPPTLHRNIKPQNVLIDVTRKARLADFGISRRLTRGQGSTVRECWKAKETIEGKGDEERSADIQVAGMLLYYIQSGGEHPFFYDEDRIEGGHYEIYEVHDEDVKDLIEWMINEDPKKRPTVEECLAHPYCWTNKKRVDFLKLVGNEEEVKNYSHPDRQELMEELDGRGGGEFDEWKDIMKDKLPEVFQEMEERRGETEYSENGFELLRFICNLHAHHAEAAADIDLMEMFPGLFDCVYEFVTANDWDKRVTLKKMFTTSSDGALGEPSIQPPAPNSPRASSSDGALGEPSCQPPAQKRPKKSA